MKHLSPPKWAPNAVATEQGWVNPKTKEVLVSLRGLKSQIEKTKSTVLNFASVNETPVETAFIDLITEPETPKKIEPETPKEVNVFEKKSKSRINKKNTLN